MSCIKFEDVKFTKLTSFMLNHAHVIIKEHEENDLVLTLRQLYYQLVARDLIPNQDREYKKLSRVLTKARMGGIISWSAIEDRLRQPIIPFSEESPESAIKMLAKYYRVNRMNNQDIYIEVWCEKDALSGVLNQVVNKYGIPLIINRGYSSTSAMYEAGSRIKKALYQTKASKCKILYFGDFDPSGLDMVNDIKSRLETFLGDDYEKLSIDSIGLNMDQVRKYNLPPNPAKMKDPRSSNFVNSHGVYSYELDALPTLELQNILEGELDKIIDFDTFKTMEDQESADRKKLIDLTKM